MQSAAGTGIWRLLSLQLVLLHQTHNTSCARDHDKLLWCRLQDSCLSQLLQTSAGCDSGVHRAAAAIAAVDAQKSPYSERKQSCSGLNV